MFSKFWKQIQESNKELSAKEERWENTVDLPEFNGEDMSNASAMRFLSAWLGNEETKRKRGYRK